MAENVVSTKLKMTTEGTESAVAQMQALNKSAEEVAASIQQADNASQDLNASVASTPEINAQSQSLLQSLKAKAGDFGKSIEGVASKFEDTGKAGEQFVGVLDRVIPGLGGVAQSFISMNPLAIAGTVAITGLSLAFGEMQKHAEDARKAIEEETKAQIKAETDRIASLTDIDQRVNAALSGNKAARDGIIRDLADATAQAAQLSAQKVSIEEREAQAKKDQIEFTQKGIEQARAGRGIDQAIIDGAARAKASLDELAAESKTLDAQIQDNATQFTQLNDAAKRLNITAEEQSAVMKAVTEGTTGANAALDQLSQVTKDNAAGLNDVGKGLENVFSKLKNSVLKAVEDSAKAQAEAAEKAAKEREAAEKRLIDVNEKLASVEMDRGKALADRVTEDARAAKFAELDQKLAAAQAYDAAREKNKKLNDIQQQGHAEDIAAQQKYMESQQKLLGSYLKAEQQATEDYSRERVRRLEDLYNTLNDLASQRDVAGFVNARRAGMTDIGRMDEDAGVSARRRREQYQQQQADLDSAYAKERATRQSQLQQRLQQEQQAGQQQITQASIVQKQIADLRAQYAAQDLRARRQQEDMAYRQTVDVLQKKRMDELKITAGAASGVIDIVSRMRDNLLKLGAGLNQNAARNLPHYDAGTPFVTHDQVAVIHRGERVMTPAENARFMRGGMGGRGLTVSIGAVQVGRVASQSDIDTAVRGIVDGIASYAANSNT